MLSSVPATMPLLRRMATFWSSELVGEFSATATTRPYGQADAGKAESTFGSSSGFSRCCSLLAGSKSPTPSIRMIKYGFRHAFISRKPAYFCGSAGGICWSRASGLAADSSGALGGLAQQASRATSTVTAPRRRDFMLSVLSSIGASPACVPRLFPAPAEFPWTDGRTHYPTDTGARSRRRGRSARHQK
jgi:hypothetical protein